MRYKQQKISGIPGNGIPKHEVGVTSNVILGKIVIVVTGKLYDNVPAIVVSNTFHDLEIVLSSDYHGTSRSPIPPTKLTQWRLVPSKTY